MRKATADDLSCHRLVRAQLSDASSGERFVCPTCQAELAVPAAAAGDPLAALSCPYCAEWAVRDC